MTHLHSCQNEILMSDSNCLISFSGCRDYDREQFAENPVPLLLIGTKFDQIPENKRSEVLTRTAFLSEDFNAEEINLVGFFCLFFAVLHVYLHRKHCSLMSAQKLSLWQFAWEI